MTQISELHDASFKPWTQLSSFTVLVFLLLTQNCSGLSQVVGPSQLVLATVGDDVVLSCRLEPAVDASDMSIEWSRQDLDPTYVYVWWDREELENSKHHDYKGRTSLLFSKLKFGDISLKISKVKPSDKGKYRCFIPALSQGSTVELVVGDFFMSQSSYISTIAGLAAAIILLILAVFLFVRTGKQRWKRKKKKQAEFDRIKKEYDDIKNQLHQEEEKSKKAENEAKILKSHLEKRMRSGIKLKTAVQKMIQELNEMNVDSNSGPTESDEKNQQGEFEKLQNEKQKWMKTAGNLNIELQSMNKKLERIAPIILEEVDEHGYYIRLRNISTEEIKLGGWKLKLQRDDNEPDILMFDESLKLEIGGILCLRSPNWSNKNPYDADLEWSKLIPWWPEERLQINLIRRDEEKFKLL